MQAVALVRTSSLRPVLEFRERFLAPSTHSLSLPQPRFRGADSLVPLAYAGLLWEEAARASGIEELGLRIGEATRITEFGEWGAALGRSRTVGAALETATRVSRRFNSGQRFWIARHGGDVWVNRSFSDSLRRGRQQVSDFTLMLMTEYKDLATMEANEAKRDAVAQRVIGNDAKQMQGYKDRLEIREVLGSRLAREIILTPR